MSEIDDLKEEIEILKEKNEELEMKICDLECENSDLSESVLNSFDEDEFYSKKEKFCEKAYEKGHKDKEADIPLMKGWLNYKIEERI